MRLAAAAVALAMAVTACAPSTTTRADQGKITLSVWGWGPEANYDKMFAEYEKANPGVDVDARSFTTATEYDTILSTGLAGDNGPDLAWLRAGANLQPLVEAGRLLPLDTKDVPGLAAYDEKVLRYAKGDKDGKVYGVPFAVQTLQVIYNKKIFADNGITPPKTYDEMISSAQKLKAKGIIPFAFGGKDDWMLPIVASIFGTAHWGGDDFIAAVKAKQKKFADPRFVEGIDQLNKLKPYFPDNAAGVSYTDAQILFSSGKAAMFPGGLWELNFFGENAKDIELGVFTPPVPEGQGLMPGFTDGSYGVNVKTRHKAEALKFAAWLASKDYGQLYTDTLRIFSAVPGVTPKDPLLGEVSTTFDRHGATYFMNEFAYGNPSSAAVFSKALQEMLLGRITAKQAAEQLDKSVSTWL
ncbi:ABC transporter substrate-binding protein [Nonomuraea roseoviolacea]|uniref:Raffinose/stachyose/melibiose transport system substrate-binding protein n=1 Tax=Nonomuraea roseoviolacea subsp. carminata TaxID=160689 RepID=A0ABT1KDY7_9ACTN|nr:extracellular solute-binding protein [Nonomuraea roseoviolacea]MCP2352196.1 raffinose/stachyose/melibiose transport system substrate-binding protein [Nonomuraea roseoviolacea subsp. carminata]